MPCVFCLIAGGELPSHRIAERERALAFLDINPSVVGHTLVVPQIHAASLHEVSHEDLAACAELAQEVAARLVDRLACDGVSIVQSNGAAAGQTVFHYHVHVIPRFDRDALRTIWDPTHPEPDELAAMAERLAG